MKGGFSVERSWVPMATSVSEGRWRQGGPLGMLHVVHVVHVVTMISRRILGDVRCDNVFGDCSGF